MVRRLRVPSSAPHALSHPGFCVSEDQIHAAAEGKVVTPAVCPDQIDCMSGRLHAPDLDAAISKAAAIPADPGLIDPIERQGLGVGKDTWAGDNLARVVSDLVELLKEWAALLHHEPRGAKNATSP
jgi:hypothetical protein